MSWPTEDRRRRLAASLALVLAVARPSASAFEITGEGARAAALGKAFAAAAGAAESVWFNPAGSAAADRVEAVATYAVVHPGLDEPLALNSLAAVAPWRSGGIGLGVATLGVEGWREWAMAAGYGRALGRRFGAGVQVRRLSWQAGSLAQATWSLGLGGTYEMGWVLPRAYVRLGLAASDLNRPNTAAGGQASARRRPALVAALTVRTEEGVLYVDVESRQGPDALRVGLETQPSAGLGRTRLRLGADLSAAGPAAEGGLHAGIGQAWRSWRFDYAYDVPFRLRSLGGMHRVSIGYQR